MARSTALGVRPRAAPLERDQVLDFPHCIDWHVSACSPGGAVRVLAQYTRLSEVAVDVRENAPLIAAGGGVLLFIALFMSWFGPFSAWEAFDLTDIVLALIAILAI